MESEPTMKPYDDLSLYFGDLHNHCDISYGHGSLQDALANARVQLDFCAVTGHAHWHDMPKDSTDAADIIEFHRNGFAKLRDNWTMFQEEMSKHDEPGRFVPFLSYEDHSNRYGDYTIVHRRLDGELFSTDVLPKLISELRNNSLLGSEIIGFPHHIGYLQGHRGVDWKSFSSEFSPMVELFSMHGSSENGYSGRPFLHAMGPLDWESTMQAGIENGHLFGVIGSTDHHNGFPGSYGHGLAAIWAEDLTRESLWNSIRKRRVYAVSGDRMSLEFSVNGLPMGGVSEGETNRVIEGRIVAGDSIDYIDVVKNGAVFRRFSPDVDQSQAVPEGRPIRAKIPVTVGWGRRGNRVDWDVSVTLTEGRILGVEPRFRGIDILSPRDQDTSVQGGSEHRWQQDHPTGASFTTATYGNPNVHTHGNQGLCLDVSLPPDAQIQISVNGKRESVPFERLRKGPAAGYLSDEPSAPAWQIGHASIESEFAFSFLLEDANATTSDVQSYYLRVRQKNGQWGWTSPVFLTGA